MSLSDSINRDILLISSKYNYLRAMQFHFEVSSFNITLHIEEDNKNNSEFYQFLKEFEEVYHSFLIIVKFDIFHPWND